MIACSACTFENKNDVKQCEICETPIELLFELSLESSDFIKRWQSAKIIVIGACYNETDNAFWSQVDENYIGIGMGTHCFQIEPHWQRNWNSDGFWEAPTPLRPLGFKYVFLDRCVWNIVMHNIKPVLGFVKKMLQDNGCFLISKTAWKPACEIYLKDQFINHAQPEYKRRLENEIDVKAVNELKQNGGFMITNGYTCYHKSNDPNNQDRKKWKAFMKMKPMK